MSEVIRVEDRFYILASSSLAEGTTRALKHGETFALFDRHGDVRPLGFENHGIYDGGTRFLSHYKLTIEDRTPLLLSSAVREDNDFLAVDLTNPDFDDRDGRPVRRGDIHVSRLIFLWNGCCHERIEISNYGRARVAFSLSLAFDADFVDIFEVRGMQRHQRGSTLPPVTDDAHVTLGYRGLDEQTRTMRIDLAPRPEELRADGAKFDLELDPQQKTVIDVAVSCRVDNPATSFGEAIGSVQRAWHRRHEEACVIETSNEQFNNWLNRSKADLDMMLTDTTGGVYPYAGIPWFSTVFGRDGIITALQVLAVNPRLARGVLKYLAENQAREVIPEQEAEPGKILHEERKGEMAALREIPFGRYYGSIDSTPLFVVLAGHYYERTGDTELIREIWPNIEAALGWIDDYGDVDGDGFVEYERRSADGLVQQGWKDSDDSVFHADGSMVEAPVALCEVQGYVYEAKRRAASLAFVLGNAQLALRLEREARALQEKFQAAFWCDELGTYALALDGQKRPCRVKSSNAGQCLFTGIASEAHAASIAQGLVSDPFFSGWGIRTLATTEARYNPMSYHNGSIWPHDNSLIAFGMGRYGLKDAALEVLAGVFDASLFVDLHRLPELYCGFERRKGEGPTLYPVACDPQAWACGSVFLMLQSCLGLSVQAPEQKVYFNKPTLAPFLQEVTIRNLKVGASTLDVALQRHAEDVSVNVLRRDGDVEVVAIK